MLKRSKQRESIKKFLISRYDHPTAETVYMNIKEEFQSRYGIPQSVITGRYR